MRSRRCKYAKIKVNDQIGAKLSATVRTEAARNEISLEQHFINWETEVFGHGYGSGELHVLPALKTLLELVPREGLGEVYDHEILEREVGAATAWLLIGILCRAGILQYGTSPRHGWLTPAGGRLRDFVSARSAEELVSIVTEGDPLPAGNDPFTQD